MTSELGIVAMAVTSCILFYPFLVSFLLSPSSYFCGIQLSLAPSTLQGSGYGMKDGSAADVSTMYGSGLGASPAGYYPYDPTFAAYG